VPPDQLDAEVESLLASIVAKPREALAIGKDLFYRQRELGVEAAYQLAGQTMAVNMMASCAQEGVSAFTEKRKPSWSPRGMTRSTNWSRTWAIRGCLSNSACCWAACWRPTASAGWWAAASRPTRSGSAAPRRRLLFPLLALALTFGASRVVGSYQHVVLLRLAVPVLVSLAGIRFIARVLTLVFPASGFARLMERLFSWLAWIGAALWAVGVLPAVMARWTTSASRSASRTSAC
jgi:hypothetical protein